MFYLGNKTQIVSSVDGVNWSVPTIVTFAGAIAPIWGYDLLGGSFNYSPTLGYLFVGDTTNSGTAVSNIFSAPKSAMGTFTSLASQPTLPSRDFQAILAVSY